VADILGSNKLGALVMHKISITTIIIIICIDIQGEEHHCQEEHYQSNDSGIMPGCQYRNARSNGGEIRLIALSSCY
jgi:hypothetical protein